MQMGVMTNTSAKALDFLRDSPTRARTGAIVSDAGEDWARLGTLLSERRGRLGPQMKSRQKFSAATGLNERLVADLENARRVGYKPATLAAVERAYSWAAGSVQRVLDGGDPIEVAAVTATSHLALAGHAAAGQRSVADAVDVLAAVAEAEGRSVGELLREHGVEAGEQEPASTRGSWDDRFRYMTLGEILVERGLADPAGLGISDDIRGDPLVRRILEWPNSSDRKIDNLLRAYADLRRGVFDQIQGDNER